MLVPFVDLTATNHGTIGGVLADVEQAILTGRFIGGHAVEEFEDDLAGYTAQGYAVGVSSGLDALRLALLAVGAKGRFVIVPAMTFAATWEAVVQAGCVPIAVDVDEHGLIDVEAANAARFTEVAAIVPVHLYGALADMLALVKAFPPGYSIVEDAAQALGASRDGYRAGEFSRAVAHSFYPTKGLGAFGDAGAVTTSTSWVASRVRELREHGQRTPNEHTQVGYTARLDAIQASVLSRKLPDVDAMIRSRRVAAARYAALLADVGDLVLPDPPGESSWHLYPVRTADPEALASYLLTQGVGTGRHYPVAVHHQAAFARYKRGEFPMAERIAAETLSLPIWPGITHAQQEHVASAIREWFNG